MRDRNFCVSFHFRKVNKCYKGRSCPIIVHCRQVQLSGGFIITPARAEGTKGAPLAPKAVCSRHGTCARSVFSGSPCARTAVWPQRACLPLASPTPRGATAAASLVYGAVAAAVWNPVQMVRHTQGR